MPFLTSMLVQRLLQTPRLVAAPATRPSAARAALPPPAAVSTSPLVVRSWAGAVGAESRHSRALRRRRAAAAACALAGGMLLHSSEASLFWPSAACAEVWLLQRCAGAGGMLVCAAATHP